jgi:excisionase family DNA binding protein
MDSPRFLRLEDVADELNVSMVQARALVRSGELKAIKVGGRGVWRVERSEFEAYIAQQYQATEQALAAEEADADHDVEV